MAHYIRLANGRPITDAVAERLMHDLVGVYLESWSADLPRCPRCLVLIVLVHPITPDARLCPGCGERYYCRVVEGGTYVTSTDDPTLREGGA